MTKKKRYNLCFRSLFSLQLMYIYIYYLYRKKRRDDRGCRRRKKSQTIDRVCESARRPMVSLQQFSQARVFGGCSSLESLCLLERVYGPKIWKNKKNKQKKKERRTRKTGESIFGEEPVCAPPAGRHQMKMRKQYTHTHIFTVYRHDRMEGYIQQSIRQPNGIDKQKKNQKKVLCHQNVFRNYVSFFRLSPR